MLKNGQTYLKNLVKNNASCLFLFITNGFQFIAIGTCTRNICEIQIKMNIYEKYIVSKEVSSRNCFARYNKPPFFANLFSTVLM